jgi:tetratricopeptide (TPR) repeat protein
VETRAAAADRYRIRKTAVRLLVPLLATLGLAAATARADETVDDHVAHAREAHDRGDFARARDELLAAYQLEPRPALLFALGQVELNLGHYKEAIAYYERFKATDPPAEQVALAEQGIGAARLELDRPRPPPPRPPPPPPPPPHREWDVADAALAATGGAALFASGLFFYRSARLADDRSGSLATYDHRIADAHLSRDVAIGCAAAGALSIGAALVRWRFHLVQTTVAVDASPTGAAMLLEHRW